MSASDPGAGPATRTSFTTWMTVVALMLATVLEILDSSIVNVALPHIMGNVGATFEEVSWVVTGYIVSNVMVIPLTGWLQQRFGRKRYLTSSVILFTVASALCGAATSLPELVVFRVLQGVGGGALLVTSQAILIETFPAGKQAMGQSIFGLGVMVGPSLGPTLGGWITDTYSWRWIFYVNLPLGALAAVLCAIYLHDPPHLRGASRERTADYWGIALLIAGIGCLQMLLERGHRLDWFASPTIVMLAVVSALSLVAFVARELTTEHPAVDLRALRHPNLAIGCILGSVVGAGLYGAIFLFPLFSQSLLGWTAWQCGMSILPSALAMAASMFIAGRLATRFGPRPVLFAGMCVFITSLWFMTHWTHLSGADEVFWPQVGRGIALGAMFVPLSMVALRSLPLAEVPNAAGLYNLSRQLGGSFGVALLGTLVDHRSMIHRAQLGEHVSTFDPVVWERMAHLKETFIARGLDASSALEATLRALDHSLHVQAQMLAFADGYRSLILLGLLSLPLMALVRRKAAPAGPTSNVEATEAALHAH